MVSGWDNSIEGLEIRILLWFPQGCQQGFSNHFEIYCPEIPWVNIEYNFPSSKPEHHWGFYTEM